MIIYLYHDLPSGRYCLANMDNNSIGIGYANMTQALRSALDYYYALGHNSRHSFDLVDSSGKCLFTVTFNPPNK